MESTNNIHEYGEYLYYLNGFETNQLRKFLDDTGRKGGLMIKAKDRELLIADSNGSIGLRFYDNTDDRGR